METGKDIIRNILRANNHSFKEGSILINNKKLKFDFILEKLKIIIQTNFPKNITDLRANNIATISGYSILIYIEEETQKTNFELTLNYHLRRIRSLRENLRQI